jgi:hypothetical protein
VILECCIYSDTTTFERLEAWTKTTQAMEKWPFLTRVRYYNWLRANEKEEPKKYGDPTTGLLVNILCSEHTKQVVEEAGLLVSWSGDDAVLPLDTKRDKYGPTFHIGPYMLQSRIYPNAWSVCSQGHPNVLLRLPYSYEAAYEWSDVVWKSTKHPPKEASVTEVELATKLRDINGYHKLSHAGQVRASLVLGEEPPKRLTRQHHWRVTVVDDTISTLGGYDPYPGTPRSRAKTAVQRLTKLAYPDGPPVWADPTQDRKVRKEAYDKAWEYLEAKAKELWPDK